MKSAARKVEILDPMPHKTYPFATLLIEERRAIEWAALKDVLMGAAAIALCVVATILVMLL